MTEFSQSIENLRGAQSSCIYISLLMRRGPLGHPIVPLCRAEPQPLPTQPFAGIKTSTWENADSKAGKATDTAATP